MSTNLPKVEESNKFNLFTSIWIVPFIALMIAGWLAYQYFDDLGPEIEIIFPKNEGLVAGQSVVKFKNVPIGKVTKIYITQDTDGVIVRVRMNSKAAKPYMTEKARFWIVKPEVGFSGISGLDTLLSGTYIDVYSEAGGTFRERHIGLSQPYQDTSKGKYFHLRSEDGKNISVGMPIFYKNIKVGKVAYKYLSLDNKHVDVVVYVQNQYDAYIHTDTKFWMKNTMTVDFTRGKIDVDIAPLNFLLTGGIVFSSPSIKKDMKTPSDYIFTLHKSQTAAESHTVGSGMKEHKKFLLLTEDSISSLSHGSVVRFDGFDIGKVLKIKLSYNKNKHHMVGAVLIEIDTSVFDDLHDTNSTGEENFYQAVEEGLRAKIAALDPITGAQYVDLTFHHHDGEGTIIQGEKYASLPMTSQSSSGIMDSVSQILDKLNNLPLDELVSSVKKVVDTAQKPVKHVDELIVQLTRTVDDINKMTSKKSFEVMPDELNRALREMTKTLKSTQKVVKGYDSDSLVKEQLTQTLKILTKTSQEMQAFLRMLNRKPNSLIFGDN
ncbi:MAG: MCE family protein [Epsilonproteobacteria bacterium]|nr:MCE family protein [Campylobacterota bacterium]